MSQTTNHHHAYINDILEYLHQRRGFDSSGYRPPMLKRRIGNRLAKLNMDSHQEYFDYLKSHEDELTALQEVLTINISRFFRNTYIFEYISKHLLPEIISKKLSSNDKIIRIWSAGCSTGEEPFSMAILLNELIKNEYQNMRTMIIATDIDEKVIQHARKGIYSSDRVGNIRHRLIKKYFIQNEDEFALSPEILKIVMFSKYDMLDKNVNSPPESIYGDFDVVLCRNLLIYFKLDSQKQIFEKLYNSLNENGVLILGESESIIGPFKDKFLKESRLCKIFTRLN